MEIQTVLEKQKKPVHVMRLEGGLSAQTGGTNSSLLRNWTTEPTQITDDCSHVCVFQHFLYAEVRTVCNYVACLVQPDVGKKANEPLEEESDLDVCHIVDGLCFCTEHFRTGPVKA